MAKSKFLHQFPAFDAFREMVDPALETLLVRPIPKENLHYPVAYESLREALGEMSEGLAEADGDVVEIAEKLAEIVSEAVFSNVLRGTEAEPYLSIAEMLRDALRMASSMPAMQGNDPRWFEAIRIAAAYRLVTPQNLHSHARERTLALAVNYFNLRQIALSMHGRHVNVPAHGIKLATAETVLAPLRHLGEQRCMQLLDNILDSRFDHRVSRLHFHPLPDAMGNKVERQLPCGLLYRYALKTLGRKSTSRIHKTDVDKITQSATHIAALHDVEPFSIYETMLPSSPKKLADTLTGIALFDELFAVPQCPPVVISTLLATLQKEVPSRLATNVLQWSMADAYELWRLLLECSPHLARSSFIDQVDLRSKLANRVGGRASEQLLRSFVMINPNANYYLPVDACLAETRECALVKASGGRYWLPGQLILGPAFFARLVHVRAEVDSSFSDSVGPAFEKHLFERLKNIGISCRRGNVRGERKATRAGDLDLVLESPSTVALFELKKKGLTRLSFTGDGVQLLGDLALGFVRGLNQISQHENTLMRDGCLSFEDGARLDLGNRRVIKGVISLADYGGLHDASTAYNFLNGAAGACITARTTLGQDQAGLLAKTNKEFDRLGRRYKEFEEALRYGHPELSPSSPHDRGVGFADNVVFCNVYLIEYLLNQAKTAEELLQALSSGTRISLGTRDQFFEHARMFYQ